MFAPLSVMFGSVPVENRLPVSLLTDYALRAGIDGQTHLSEDPMVPRRNWHLPRRVVAPASKGLSLSRSR